MIFGLVLVLGLALVMIRYVLPKTGLASRRRGLKGAIEVVDRVPLDQRKYLSLVKILGRYFVLGVSEHAVHPVAELTAEEGARLEKEGTP